MHVCSYAGTISSVSHNPNTHVYTHMYTYATHITLPTVFDLVMGQSDNDSALSECGLLNSEVSEVTLTDGADIDMSPDRSPLDPPSWRTHANSDRDVLKDVSL